MRINSTKHNNDKFHLSITFSSEIEERIFLKKILTWFSKILSVNCILTDLDTSYSVYEKYFDRKNYYVFEHSTVVSIFAFDLNLAEIENVISNWGYYTIDAMFALGAVNDEIMNHKLDGTNILKSMPIVITQVLDNSIDITIEQYYFEDISNFLNTGDG